MRITFQQQNITELQKDQVPSKSAAGSVDKRNPSWGTQGAGVYLEKSMVNPGPGETERGKSFIELQQELGSTDVGVLQDYMTLMSNTMSKEDYAKLQEEGFDFGSMSPEETVTIIDRIKAELLRSGVQIEGYTDDMDMEVLAEALGSATLANAVSESFAKADIPLTKENIAAIETAAHLSQELKNPDVGVMHYLIDNKLDLNLWNLYLAQNSGATIKSDHGRMPAFSAEQIKGYYAKNESVSEWSGLTQQIDKLLEQSGYEITDENRESAKWLIENRLVLTKDSLDLLTELKNLKLPLSEQTFSENVAIAIQNQKHPSYASVSEKPESIYEKAIRIDEYYHSEEVWEETQSNLIARRQLEEIRLRMTAEVNVKLIKSGFAIDTAPMEQLVDALRQAEKQLATQYFPKEEMPVEKFRLYEKAQNVVRELPMLPAVAIGQIQDRPGQLSAEEFYEVGKNLKQTFEKAGERYETLMTAPRSDLGDSMKKAFANVDSILEDLGQKTTEENRRAVRILGFNHMTIDLENIEKIKAADRQVQSVIEKLTPGVTLKMIRDGMNPLEKSFAELEDYFKELEPQYHQEAESYSRFLYGLERQGEITPEERESFIGIYRLLRQIEKSDGAVIGALVNTQAELHFSNLLSAIRSGKVKHVDIKAGENVGLLSEVLKKGESISEQIGKAFTDLAKNVVTQMSYSGEITGEYQKEQLDEYRNALSNANQECIALLERGEFPANAENILVAKALLEESSLPVQILRKEKRTETIWEKLDEEESFTEAYEDTLETAKEEVEKTTFLADQSSLDVRRLQLAHKQLTIASALSQKQEYFLPMQIGEQVSKVHLTIQHSEERAASVDIDVKLPNGEDLHADFRFAGGLLYGNIYAEKQNKVMNCERIADNFIKEAGDTWKMGEIKTGYPGARIATTEVGTDAEIENSELYRVAKMFLAAVRNGESYEN